MKVLAILCADLHLSHRPPIARSSEPSWYSAMERPLDQVAAIAREHKACIISAGDVVDHWNQPPEFLEWAIRKLPQPFYSVAGQHDLPGHQYEDRRRSAYGVLEGAGVIRNIPPGGRVDVGSVSLYGFPWEAVITPPPDGNRNLKIAVVHSYIWMKGHSYPGAPADKRLSTYRAALRGYDVAVFGDNHLPFYAFSDVNGGCRIFNCGGFMRRDIDQVDHKPSVGLLYEDGTIERHYLDISQDVLAPKILGRTEEQITGQLDMAAFVDELGGLDATRLDFPAAIRRAAEGLTPRAKAVLLTALGV